TYQWVLKNL
nr:Chain C, PB2-549-557 peptide from Influenza B, TYQWVLKNL [Influenza B virus]6XQA_F Chain F, PB2-549-557 peptide from Influenza B, TYQWVLKNL [Influenza B virus]